MITARAIEDIYSIFKKELLAPKGEVLKIISTRHKPVYIVENKQGYRFSVTLEKITITSKNI